MGRLLVYIAFAYFLIGCSKHGEPDSQNRVLPGFSLCFSEKIVEKSVIVHKTAWMSLERVDIYLYGNGREVAFKDCPLEGNELLMTGRMPVEQGKYEIRNIVFYNGFGEEVINNGYEGVMVEVPAEGSVTLEIKVENEALTGADCDYIGMSALMKANFGVEEKNWPVNLRDKMPNWKYVITSEVYDADLPVRVVALDFNALAQDSAAWGEQALRIRILPKELALMDEVKAINLSGNPVELVAEEVGQMKSLKNVYLSDCGLKELPALWLRPQQLDRLFIDHNPLEQLPEITFDTPLTYLDIRESGIVKLGRELIRYPELRSVYAPKCRISEVEDLTVVAPQMVALDLSDNRLEDLPDGVITPAMRALYLSGNRLKQLPDPSGQPVLETVKAERNQLETVPAAYAALPALNQLEVGENNLTALPDFSGNKVLLRLGLKNNPALEWDMPETWRARYCACTGRNIEGEPEWGNGGLFVDVRGCPKVTGVPALKFCGK